MNRSILCGLTSFAMLVGVSLFSSGTPTAEARHGCGGGLFGGHHRTQVCSGGARGGLFKGQRGGCGGKLFGHHRGRSNSCGGYVSSSNACCDTGSYVVHQPQSYCPQPVVQQSCCAPQTACCGSSGYQTSSYPSGGMAPGSGCVGCDGGQVYSQDGYSAGYGSQPQHGGQPQGWQPQGGQHQGGQYQGGQEQYDEI